MRAVFYFRPHICGLFLLLPRHFSAADCFSYYSIRLLRFTAFFSAKSSNTFPCNSSELFHTVSCFIFRFIRGATDCTADFFCCFGIRNMPKTICFCCDASSRIGFPRHSNKCAVPVGIYASLRPNISLLSVFAEL